MDKVWAWIEELLTAKKKELRVRISYQLDSVENDPLSSDFDPFYDFAE